MASRKMVRSTFGRCYYCGALDNVTNDHFIPQSKGGRIVVPACTLCQWTKRDLMPLEFAEYMEGPAAVTPQSLEADPGSGGYFTRKTK